MNFQHTNCLVSQFFVLLLQLFLSSEIFSLGLDHVDEQTPVWQHDRGNAAHLYLELIGVSTQNRSCKNQIFIK